MDKTILTLLDDIDDALGMLWVQMYQLGHIHFQRDIEEVAELFMYTNDTPLGQEAVERAHRVFERVHDEYTPEIQKRIGHQLVRCPYCEQEDKRHV